MATLSLTNTFIAGTLAKASEVNQNFTDLVNWSSGNIQNDNIGTLNGTITWSVTTGVKAISIANSGNEGSIGITQSVALNPNKATLRIIDNAAQVSGDAEVYVSMTSISSTIPVLRLDYGGAQVFAAKKDRLEFPSRTSAQRTAIIGAVTGSILYNSTNKSLEAHDGTGWAAMSVPVGVMLPFAGAGAVPDGYHPCDGTTRIKTEYPNLYAILLATWGSDAGLTFTLPNMQRKVAMGSGGTQVSGPANTVGSTGGFETHTLVTGELAQHSHSGTVGTESSHTHNTRMASMTGTTAPIPSVPSGGVSVFQNSPNSTFFSAHSTGTGELANGVTQAGSSHGHGFSGANTGSDTAHNNVQPSAVVNYIIKW